MRRDDVKFSILLPTRNRLEYLRLAVESVLLQDWQDWQIVISDNCSEQDISGFVASLGDPRIVYRRTERPVPVTENWNRALAHSDGDYVIMLGDDDALLGGYLRTMDGLLQRFEQPDVVYTKALLFTYPGVDPQHPEGFLMDHGCAEFFAGASQPFVLDRQRAVAMVGAAMDFRLSYDFNAQFALIGRRLIDELSGFGDFYQSDFPDYYSMNAAFLRARRIVVDPAPRVVIGVTPKSYGFFHVNRKESEGREFLGAASRPPSSGTNINVGWLSAMEALEKGVAAEFGLRPNRRRYRFVQAVHVYERFRAGAADRDAVRRLELELPLVERLAYRWSSALLGLLHRALPRKLRTAMISLAHRVVGQLPPVAPNIVAGRYRDILEVCSDRESQTSAATTAQRPGQ